MCIVSLDAECSLPYPRRKYIPAARKLLTTKQSGKNNVPQPNTKHAWFAIPMPVKGFKLSTILNVMAKINISNLMRRNKLCMSF